MYKFAYQIRRSALYWLASLSALASCALAVAQTPAVPPAPTAQRLFQISPADTNIFAFQLTLQELRREHRSSVVKASGFHGRPAASTRWMMCMLNTLAIQRGFEFWTVVYPEYPSEELLVGFLEYRQEKIADRDPRFTSKQAIPLVVPIERGVQFCKAYQQELQGKG